MTIDVGAVDETREYRCECCERKLNPQTMTWLELSFR
jgi:hypothetical protein